MTERSVVVSGALQRHQVKQYLERLGVEWEAIHYADESRFSIRIASDEQWERIQAWVKKVTG